MKGKQKAGIPCFSRMINDQGIPPYHIRVFNNQIFSSGITGHMSMEGILDLATINIFSCLFSLQ